MTVTILSNERDTRDAFVPPPTLVNGTRPVQWRMFYDNNRQIADSDSLAELINVLIPDYKYLNDDLKRLKRIEYATQVRNSLRALILSNVPAEEWEALSDVEKYFLEYNDEFDPDFADEEGAPFIWKSDIPLVLLDIYYPPYDEALGTAPLSVHGDVPTPANILWLRPDDELTFLITLTHAGVIAFGEPRAVHRTPQDLR